MNMNSTTVDDFSARLTAELSALSWADRNDLLVKIAKQETTMRAAGQERPVWRGPAPVDELLGADVVVSTDQGDRRGRVICYGIVRSDVVYERSVVVHVPSSGTHHEALGSSVRLAAPDDVDRMRAEVEMAGRLALAAEAAIRGPKDPQRALERQKRRGQKDPGLVAQMLEIARSHPMVASVTEGAANHKVIGLDPTRRVYIFKGQLRVDVSGVQIEHPAIRQVSDDEARDMHLGKVRGQLIFDDRGQALAALSAVLDNLT